MVCVKRFISYFAAASGLADLTHCIDQSLELPALYFLYQLPYKRNPINMDIFGELIELKPTIVKVSYFSM